MVGSPALLYKQLAWLAVQWCERSLMAPTVRAMWWWSLQVAKAPFSICTKSKHSTGH